MTHRADSENKTKQSLGRTDGGTDRGVGAVEQINKQT